MIEITAETEFVDPVIISVDDDTASMGVKRFESVGHFHYEWWTHHMSVDDITGLIKALQFAHAMMETE